MTAPKAQPEWQPTQARVTGCKYEFGGQNALTLGIHTDPNRFLISFTYYAHAQTYTGEFASPTYMEQDARFPITYNPLNPQENSKSAASSAGRSSLFAIGVAGSVILSLIYLTFLRGCN